MKKLSHISIFCIVMCGCGESKMIGKLVLEGADATSFSVAVPSDSYPSRWLFFEPIEAGESGMAAYQEPIYSSRVKVTIKNVGTESLTYRYFGEEQIVPVGGVAILPEISFKDFRLVVVPTENHQANIEFHLKFDKPYSTDSWKLVAAWSDGP